MADPLSLDQLDQLLSGSTQQQAPQQVAQAPAQSQGALTLDDIDKITAATPAQPQAPHPQQVKLPDLGDGGDPFKRVQKFVAPAQQQAHVAHYAKPDLLSPLNGHMDLAPETGGNYRPVNTPADLFHNQAQAIKNGFHGMEAMAPGLMREATNLFAKPPADSTPEQAADFNKKQHESFKRDSDIGMKMAINAFPPVYIGEKYGRPIAHALLGNTIGETPEEQHLALKKLQHEFETNPLGIVLDAAPGWGLATDIGKRATKLTGKAVATAGGAAARVIPKKIADVASLRVAKLREHFPAMFSPAALGQLAKTVEASEHTAAMRSMRAAIDQAWAKIPKDLKPFTIIALERTDPKYAHILANPAVQAFAHLTDKYWAPIWEEMKARHWTTEKDELTARWWPEVAAKAYRGEIELPGNIPRDELNSVHMNDPEIENFVRDYAMNQIAQHGAAASFGRYVPIVFHGNLHKHFSGLQGHVMQAADSMTLDEIKELEHIARAPRVKARPQEQHMKGGTAIGMREKGQTTNAADAHIYKLQNVANLLAFVRQAEKLTGEIHKLHPSKQGAAALALMKRVGPYLAEAGVTSAQVHELQDLSKMIAGLRDDLPHNGKDLMQMTLFGKDDTSMVRNFNRKVNSLVRHVYVVQNMIYPIKIITSSVAFFALGTDWNPKSIFYALVAMRLMAPMKRKGKWVPSPLAAKISKDFQLPEIEGTSTGLLKAWETYIGLAHKGTNKIMQTWVTAKLLDEMSQLPRAKKMRATAILNKTFSLQAQIQDFAKGMRALHGGYVREDLYDAAHIRQELEHYASQRLSASRTIRKKLKDIESDTQKLRGLESMPSIMTKPDTAKIAELEEFIARPRGVSLHGRIAAMKELKRLNVAADKMKTVQYMTGKMQTRIEKARALIEKNKTKIETNKTLSHALVGGLKKRYVPTPDTYFLSEKKLPKSYTSKRKLTHYVDTVQMGGLGRKTAEWNKIYDDHVKWTHQLFGDYGRALPPLLDEFRGLDLWLFMHKHFLEATGYLWIHNPWKMVALQAMAQQTEKAHEQHAKERGLPNWAKNAWATNLPPQKDHIMAQFSGGWNGLAEPWRIAAFIAGLFDKEKLEPGEYEERETRDGITQYAPLVDATWTYLDPQARGVYNPYVKTIGQDSNGIGGKQYNILALAQHVKKNGWFKDGKLQVDARNDTMKNPWLDPAWPHPDVHRAFTALKKVTPGASTMVGWAEQFEGYEHSPMTVPGVPGMEFPKVDLDKGALAEKPPVTPSVLPGLSAVSPVSIKAKTDKSDLMEILAKMPPSLKKHQTADQMKLMGYVMKMLRVIDSDKKHLLPQYE